MGFMDTLGGLFTTIAPIAAGLIGGPALSTAVSALSTGDAAIVQRQAGATAAALGLTPAQIAANVAAAGAGGVGMKNRIQTVVQTLSPAGLVLKEKILSGAPFLMRKDFVALKRTMKLIRVASRRLGTGKRMTKAQQEHAERDGLIKGLLAAGDNTSTALALLDD